jgi:hypothetical protein
LIKLQEIIPILILLPHDITIVLVVMIVNLWLRLSSFVFIALTTIWGHRLVISFLLIIILEISIS